MFEHPNAILERRTAGLYVAVCRLPTMGMWGLQVAVEDRTLWRTLADEAKITAAEIRDAFEHPLLRFPADQVEVLLKGTPEAN